MTGRGAETNMTVVLPLVAAFGTTVNVASTMDVM
jgi:hypothetical protein